VDEPLPVDDHSTQTFLRYLLSLSTELALTPENLVGSFGEKSDVARLVVPALYGALRATDNPKAKILFEQWQRQFREVSGYDPSSSQLGAAALAGLYAIDETQIDIERVFFALHTYYATLRAFRNPRFRRSWGSPRPPRCSLKGVSSNLKRR